MKFFHKRINTLIIAAVVAAIAVFSSPALSYYPMYHEGRQPSNQLLNGGSIFGQTRTTPGRDNVVNSTLDSRTQPKFINSLPTVKRIDATKGGSFHVEMRQKQQWLGLYASSGADGIYGTLDDERLNTTVWGYGLQGQAGVTYPGPTFIAQKNVPIEVLWDNKLPTNGHPLPIDTNTHLQSDLEHALENGYVPTVSHLHGGHTESASDGLPEAWFTQDFLETGHDWVKRNYYYANDQEAATLWYHDHALGITRLNLYMGLAGF
jgi:spore coat protein A